MRPTEPLPLFHSWPILDDGHRFDLGWISDHEMSVDANSFFPSLDEQVFAQHAVGQWECDLDDSSLTWSKEVYDLFGLPYGTDLSRAKIVAQYCEGSRVAMERLRAYAIKHRRGFTLDAEIRKVDGTSCWMRLMAAPVCVENRAVRLVGLKRQIDCHRR
ncbi:MAG TPA: hypothetical protein VF509_04530 [Sphingobium sp.]